jgi:hypothetical protein
VGRARRKQNPDDQRDLSMDTEADSAHKSTQYGFADERHNIHGGDDGESASTWESGNSEALTSVISGSSVWTDSSSNPADRSSRRALILQMAKARMKSNKERDPPEKTIAEEKSGEQSVDDADMSHDEHSMRQQGSAELGPAELDFAVELD